MSFYYKPFLLLVLCFLSLSLTCSLNLITLITLSCVSISVNYWLVPGGTAWKNYHQNQNYNSPLKGPIGWPLLGVLPLMGPLAHRKLASIANSLKTTRLMALTLGSTRVIISSHPDTAREILSGSSFSDRPIKKSASLLMFERAIGFAPSGEYWKHLRRIAANHMFSPKRISNLEGIRHRLVDEMVVRVGREMNSRKSVVVREILQEGSLRNILESVFGSFVDKNEEEELSEMVREGYELISNFNWEDYFPNLGFLDFCGVKRRCNKLSGRVRTLVGNMVQERKITHADFCGGHDFLSALLSLPEEDRLSDSDMVAVLWEMIFRGTDTVSILLEWILARLVLHQDIQTKLQQEIDTCVSTSHVRDSDIPKLPYLQAVVKEVLRLHPPGPLLSWARLAIHDVHVDKTLIPAGTTAMVNMWAITHDPNIWADPWAFRPERFMNEEVSIMGSDLRLAPFGSGRRACPGKALGLTTVHLWLARLLQQFRWLPPAGKTVDLSETLKLSMEMSKPLTCQAVPRK